jgi:hypothetical protein
MDTLVITHQNYEYFKSLNIIPNRRIYIDSCSKNFPDDLKKWNTLISELKKLFNLQDEIERREGRSNNFYQISEQINSIRNKIKELENIMYFYEVPLIKELLTKVEYVEKIHFHRSLHRIMKIMPFDDIECIEFK